MPGWGTRPAVRASARKRRRNASSSASAGGAARTIHVTERDFKIELATKDLSEGKYVFDVANDGRTTHNLVVRGEQVDNVTTPNLGPGKSAKLTVSLVKGKYTFYCSIPGHEQLGMHVEVNVP
jgi:uncharacterized cupredoxin-like copper-binding protein